MNKITAFIIAGVLMGSIVIVKHYYPSYKDDNVVEEKIEKVVELKTGLDMDLTPTTPEK
jgi:hypothetical protein